MNKHKSKLRKRLKKKQLHVYKHSCKKKTKYYRQLSIFCKMLTKGNMFTRITNYFLLFKTIFDVLL